MSTQGVTSSALTNRRGKLCFLTVNAHYIIRGCSIRKICPASAIVRLFYCYRQQAPLVSSHFTSKLAKANKQGPPWYLRKRLFLPSQGQRWGIQRCWGPLTLTSSAVTKEFQNNWLWMKLDREPSAMPPITTMQTQEKTKVPRKWAGRLQWKRAHICSQKS